MFPRQPIGKVLARIPPGDSIRVFLHLGIFRLPDRSPTDSGHPVDTGVPAGSTSARMNTHSETVPASHRLAEPGLILVLILFALVTRLAFLYRGGTGDGDAMVMAAGMAGSIAPGAPFTESLTYGRQIGPGIYLLFRCVSPLLAGDASRVLPFLNTLGALSASLLAWPLYVAFRGSLSRPVSAAATVLVLMTPLVWEAGTYFHPITSAALLLGLAMLSWTQIGLTRKGLAYGMLMAFLGAASLLMWAEVVLAFPALLAAAALSDRGRRDLAAMAGLTVFAVATFLTVVFLIQGYTAGTPTDLATYVRRFAGAYFRLDAVPRSLVWSALALGTGTIALAAVSGAIAFKKIRSAGSQCPEDRRRLVTAVIWIAVPYLFWLSNPVPLMRHFFLVVPGVVWLLARALPSRMSIGRLATGLLILVAINLLLPEALYRTYNRTHPADPKSLHGTFFGHHAATETRIARYHALMTSIRQSAATGGDELLVQTDWEGFGYVTYGLAALPGFDPDFAIEPIAPGLAARRYTVGPGSLRLVLTEAPPAAATRPVLIERFRQALASGEIVMVSSEAAQALGIGERSGVRIY